VCSELSSAYLTITTEDGITGREVGWMGWYEQNPLLLVPVVLATVVCYDVGKWFVQRIARPAVTRLTTNKL
jgi:hypothetical protein